MSARDVFTLVPHESNSPLYLQYMAMCDRIDQQGVEIGRLLEVMTRVRQWRAWQLGEGKPTLGGVHVGTNLLKAIERFDNPRSARVRRNLVDGRYAEYTEKDGLVASISLGPGEWDLDEIKALWFGAAMPGSRTEAVS